MVRKHLPWIFNKTDEAGDLEMQIGRFQADTIVCASESLLLDYN